LGNTELRLLPRRKPKIFISYRREDSGGHAGRLHADLARHFGAKQIFIDIGDIEAGEDFVEVIDRSIQSCDVLIAVIGRQWLTVRDGEGRRLDNPSDYVRLEIGKALERRIPVVPALVQQATVPRAQDLPPDLEPLTRRNAIEITDVRWDYDVKRLVRRLDQILPEQGVEWRKLLAAVGCLLVISIGAWLLYNRPGQGAPAGNVNGGTPTPKDENTNQPGVTVNNNAGNSNAGNNNAANANLNAPANVNSADANVTPPAPPPQRAVDYDAAKDFSVTTNPKGVWTYGYIDPGASPNAATFRPYVNQGTYYDNFSGRTYEGVYAWKLPLPAGTPKGSDFGLLVAKNLTAQKIDKFEPGQLTVHPGVNGYYCVVRWTAQANGKYEVSGQFAGIGGNPTVTDVHVLHQGREIFSDDINDYQRPHRFSKSVSVTSGDVIDFVVGQGKDNQIWGDLTSLEVQITRSR